MNKKDVIVIGGGTSGLMASAAAGMHGASVLLLDKGNKLGRKMAISGGGRCNVTNIKEIDEVIQHIPGNGRFLYSTFSVFNNKDIVQFFDDLGVPLKEEDNGRMFPVTDKAQSVVEALLRRVRESGVEIRTNLGVKNVLYQEGRTVGVELMNGEKYYADAVIVAVGGKSVPHTGSTGDGYAWAEEAGHTITELFPTEVPLTSSDKLIKEKMLQGVSLRDVSLTVRNAKGKALVIHRGDMLFTHFGLSGPMALRCSQFVVKERKKHPERDVAIEIDLFPNLTLGQLTEQLQQNIRNNPKRQMKTIMKEYLTERMIPVILERAQIPEETTAAHLSQVQLHTLLQNLKALTVYVNGTLSIEKAFVTGGGVHVKEVHPKTMHSKKMQGLFFCGEVLDIHGYTGGYNITAALCTGYVAGKSAAELVQEWKEN
ncbi:BaiN/RdsA family NAD(P)/FAD-dependent oxidoreductase [Risungbinella massiliensis]|uniref:NAD(P)/FAD-dependent oxidoreductase n=1 Tax=Risungbinella massiliensis TaxID=1329796 RepID=UPI0005CC2C0A|nr:NAD(P)/FAD-dependent oxidoreductase [Risungbinella massiliensis]